jgi:hypothetical protein
MRIPVVHGVIDRRILANYQVDPTVLAKVLPAPFRPKVVNGVGIAGICLIRLKHIRPQFLSGEYGLSSENAAHRIAVEWTIDGQTREGVYIPRRDSSSKLNTLVGGRLFPGLHHHARFNVFEREGYYRVALESDDGKTHVRVEGRVSSHLPSASTFHSLSEASEFFAAGSVGYSATARPGEYDGLELRTRQWKVEPLAVDQIESSFFENEQLFSQDSIRFDCALLMRGMEHEWHGQESLCYPTAFGG